MCVLFVRLLSPLLWLLPLSSLLLLLSSSIYLPNLGGFTLTYRIQVSRTLSKWKAFSPFSILECILLMILIVNVVVIHNKLIVLTSWDLGIFVSSPLPRIFLSPDIYFIMWQFELLFSLGRQSYLYHCHDLKIFCVQNLCC